MAIESTFIRNILKEEGSRLLTNQGKAITREVKFHSNRLLQDRTTTVVPMATGGILKFTVPHYNRLLDIKRERKKKLGKGTTVRSLRIYNRFVMGTYYAVGFRVANDFTDQVKRDIRSQIGGANG
ncbi:hypothetical protein [Sphingobacterium faecium]